MVPMGPIRLPKDEPAAAPAQRALPEIALDDRDGLDAWNKRQLAEGLARAKANTREMQAKGILDEHGNRVRKDLPAEMLEGDKDCDIA